jgi:hypothetical protein
MDQSFRARWRSGPVSVLIYGITLTVTYILIARAITSGEIGLGYILLPWIVEYLLMAWIGVLLTRTWVKEPIFAAISGRIGIALAWTIALLTPYGLVIGWQALFGLDPEAGSLSVAWERFVDSGMIWACAAVTIGLAGDTFRDVSAWRVSGGPFVWPATHRFGFRLAALLALVLALPFLLALMAFVRWLLQVPGVNFEQSDPATGFQATWLVFYLFVAADSLVLAVGTWLHRRELRTQRESESNEEKT